MTEGLTSETLKDGLTRICARMEDVADQLNERDAAIGDGDLGVTMVRGARAIMADIDSLPDDIGAALVMCARAFTKTSGSTFGTLLATGLLAVSKQTEGRTAVPWAEMPDLIAIALDAMTKRGKAELGDKTALDALDALRRGSSGKDSPAAMLHGASTALTETLDQLRDQPAKRGRARILGEQSVGRDDPGMTVFVEFLAALGA